jgi:branched-subunit amino acid ABC-type transport system permease component
VLAADLLRLLLFILNRTRLGLEVRAVTQNPRMASSMGINPDRINMLTFGLGSGIAGIAGVAIGLFAQVTSELGSNYIVQSFMTVVVGGVGNIWGTLAGAGMIGSLQKASSSEPVQHAGGADLHDPLHHPVHPVPAARHHRAQAAARRGIEGMGDSIFKNGATARC